MRAGAAVVLIGGLTAAIVLGLARVRLDTSESSLLPAGDPAMAALTEKGTAFGGEPIVVLLESAKPRQLLVGSGQLPRLAGLEGRLSGLPDVSSVYGPGSVLNQIVGGAKNLLAAIGGRRQSVQQLAERQATAEHRTPAQVKAAGEQAVRDFDVRYGRLVVQALPAGLPTLYSPQFVQSVVFDPGGAARTQWRVLVPNQNSVAILVRAKPNLTESQGRALADGVRTAVAQAGLTTSRVSVSGVPVVSAALADQVRAELPWLAGLAIAGCGLVLLTVPRRGTGPARLWPLGVMVTAAAIVLAACGWLGLPVSVGVLALLPILLGVGTDFPLYLVRGAHRRQVLVSGLASATAAGCLSLCPIPIVRQLGLALAAGIVLVIALCLLLRRIGWAPRIAPTGTAGPPVTGRRPRRAAVAALLAAAVALGGAGWILLPRIGIEADPERLAEGLSAMDDARHVQEVLGTAEELAVVVTAPDVLTPQALAWMRTAEDGVITGHGDQVRPIISPWDLLRFLGANPTRDQVSAAAGLVPGYLTAAVVAPDHHRALLVFGTDLTDITAQRSMVAGLTAGLPRPPAGVHASVVGLPVVAARAYDVVSGSRYVTSLAGIAGAGLVLFAGLRRRSDAWRAVLAGALATGWGLAILWASGGSLTPLTVTLGALTTAVGCEFFVLLAEAHRRRSRALHWGVAGACANSTVGYLVLSASHLTVLRQFGLLLAVAVVLSYGAARFVLWVLPPRQLEVESPVPQRVPARLLVKESA
jgi:hypothetical protein